MLENTTKNKPHVIDLADDDEKKASENRDPISGQPGAHPVGVGLGAAAGGAAAGIATGAVIGTTAAGPVGTAVGAGIGAAVGAIAGGLAGKAGAEAVNPTVEHEYWRGHYAERPYVTPGSSYDDYGPAYQHGWESYGRHQGKSFQQAEPTLEREWSMAEGKSKLGWDKAKGAVEDAWDRVSRRSESCPSRDGGGSCH